MTLGETMGLFVAASVGPLAHVTTFRLSIGGAESNVAIGLARLGVRAAWIGRVGADDVGDLVRRELRAEGVELHVGTDASAPTGLMIKHARTASHTRVEYHRAASAGSRLSPTDIDAELVAGAQLLHITGITPALSETSARAVDRAVEIARDADVPVSFDVNHRESLWGADRATPVYRRLAARATIVFAGVDEARLLADGTSVEDLAERIAATGPSQVIVKRGADGCSAVIDGRSFGVDAVPITPIDTVGAGDAFVAGYLAELLSGSPPASRLDVAVRAGAFACLGWGDWQSLPTRTDLALLDQADPVER